ncbi:GGDEF domain-containing protein [Pseudomaricurvus alkylphenolicus]|uniref:GGDEF domain-containing protein n=1 Tax=Pseudomaricurvus alkylphenolicus TaxID=1306991 RepID=UPI0030B8A4AC
MSLENGVDRPETVEASPQAAPACPVGENRCQVIDEVVALRREVADLTEQVHTDTLTGLNNYRHFSKALDYEMERTQRTGQTTALIMVDLDYFKKVNDTWGHEIGNQALIQTAGLLKQAVRKLDIPCRYGGEEFVVILPSTDLLTSSQVAERLRHLIESTPLAVKEGVWIDLTASMGVDVYAATHDENQEEFIQRVDTLLYQAKNNGRNQVCTGERRDMQPTTTVSNDEKDALFGLFGDYGDDEEAYSED